MANVAGIHDEDDLTRKLDTQLLQRLLTYAKPHAGSLALCLLLVGLSSVAGLALPYLVKIAIDDIITPAMALEPALRGAYAPKLLWLAGGFLVVLVARFAVTYGEAVLLQKTGQKIIKTIRQEVFDHLQGMSLSFFDRHPAGRLVTRVTNDTEALNEMYTSVLVNLFKDLVLIGGVAFVMFRLHAGLAMLVFAVTPLVAIAVWIFRSRARIAFREVRTLLARINAFIAENLNGMRVVQLFNRESKQLAEFREVNQAHYRAGMGQLLLYSFFRPVLDLLAMLALALVLWYGGNQVLQAGLSIGVLYLFTSYVRHMFNPINELAEKFNILQAAMASAERIFQLLDTKPAITDAPEPLQPAGVVGGVSFENVRFAYQLPHWVLQDVTFIVKPGQTVAFVGHTGAGKSSILNLVTRFYDVQEGRVLIDGNDVKDLPQELLRRSVGLVQQDVFLFTGTIRENLKLGQELSDETVERAAKMVGAHDFIMRLPEGYETPVAERGATLSLGERQLIAFARALATDPAILILDEATAHIDSESERIIQEALQTVSKDRTTLIVAHRLSTIQHADQIIVMHKGRIHERGTHAELVKLGGLYHSLWQIQQVERVSS
ncbi:putative multidrug resistance ABC transporter ATP-binding/permease protein YheH [compost metagenome]